MSKFTIYSPNNEALYTGTPTFTGQYMKPGQLEFREIASPMLIDLQQGCYVGYESGNSIVPVYPRTGFTYKLYSVPQVKKQARPHSYGAAFVYQNVQFYDASKELEYCPFRDLVQGDNRIHFSTQPSISTFEGCDGLAKRFEACLCEQYDSEYGRQSWQVRIATVADGVTQDFYNLMTEAREFTVSGVNILECLDKIYEIWPEVGWIYTLEEVDEVPTNTIIIGGAGLNANTGTYAYGKGRGLTSITRTVANAEEMANRIYAYGDSRNMLPRWYNGLNIKDAESVDIQNLMIPVTHWGQTDGEYDAAKAYVENQASITKIGLRPKTIYFDGSGEYADIYPTIRETTIKMVRQALGSSSAPYYPKTTVYTNENVRIDRVLSVASVFDDGMAGENGKSASVSSSESLGTISGTATASAGLSQSVILVTKTFTMTRTRGTNITVSFSGSGYVATTNAQGSAGLIVSVQKGDGTDFTEVKRNFYEMPLNESSGRFNMPGTLVVRVNDLSVSNGDIIRVFVTTSVQNPDGVNDLAFSYSFEPTFSFSAAWNRAKTFTISLRQIGFDIEAQANLGEGKTIAMRSGKCVGRSFTIKSASYVDTSDSWELECFRSEDESLSQWFPNTDYPVRGLEHAGQSNEYPGDEFVLLDIAMPEIYIDMAEAKLYDAAQDLLADASVERWQYVPEIDAKFMVENDLTIRCGEYMAILDMDFIEPADGTASYFLTSNNEYFLTVHGERIRLDDGSGSVMSALVDSVVINEGEAAIPTYKVTLRDRKKKTWTESKGAEAPSSKSVGSITTTQGSGEAEPVTPGGGDSFFRLDDNDNVTLKPEYQNLWVPGWMSAGGVGEEGSGSIEHLGDIGDVSLSTPITDGQALVWDTDHWKNGTVSGSGDTISITGTTNMGSSIAKISINGGTAIDIKNKVRWEAYDSTNHTIELYANGSKYTLCEDGYSSGGSGGGIQLSDVWNSLSTASDAYANTTIHPNHIPSLSGTYVTLSTTQSNISGEKTFTTNPVHISSSSGLEVDASSYIQIGGARLVWDNGAKCIHVTMASGNTVVGLFADGPVSAGGVAAQSTVSFVTVAATQTVSGAKTFTNQITASGGLTTTHVSLSTQVVGSTTFGAVNSTGNRLYIQTSSTGKSVVMCNSSGIVYVGGYVAPTSIPSGVLFYVNEGSGYAASWESASDRRLKDNITDITHKDAVDTIMALKPSVWEWNSGVLKGTTCSGFIAQDVESIVPYMVKGTEDNKSLNYQMLHAFEVGAIQDHENRLRTLEGKMKEG